MLLDQDLLFDLADVALSTGRRDALLQGLPRGYLGLMRRDPTPKVQLMHDLAHLNRHHEIIDFVGPPLLRWLRNLQKYLDTDEDRALVSQVLAQLGVPESKARVRVEKEGRQEPVRTGTGTRRERDSVSNSGVAGHKKVKTESGSRLLRILHLSDLHERADFDGMPEKRRPKLEWDANQRGIVLGPQFHEALGEVAEGGIDIVVFTGDLADWGHPDEYAKATARIDAILDTVNVPPELFFAVPGNHDVQRIMEKGAWDTMKAWLHDGGDRSRLGRWFREVEERPMGIPSGTRANLLKRTSAFWSSIESYGGGNLRPQAPKHLGYRKTLPAKTFKGVDVPIHIIGLDSAWLCGGDDDQGRILVTEDQVLGHIRDGAEPLIGLKIALIHHPLGELSDGNQVRRILGGNGVDLLLHGHQHDPLVIDTIEPGAALRVIAAGCLIEGDLGKGWPNGFHLIEVDPANGAGAVHFRKWSKRASYWAKGCDLYRGAPNGMLPLQGVGEDTANPQ